MAIHAFMISSGFSIRFSVTRSHDSRQLDTVRSQKRNCQGDEMLEGLVCVWSRWRWKVGRGRSRWLGRRRGSRELDAKPRDERGVMWPFCQTGDSREDICILALFGVRQSVSSWGKLLLTAQEVNLRYCVPNISLKVCPSFDSSSPSSYPSNIEQFL